MGNCTAPFSNYRRQNRTQIAVFSLKITSGFCQQGDGTGENRPTQYLVFRAEGYGAVPTIVKTFFELFSIKKTIADQDLGELSR
jgi:hypothetical protein